MKTPNRNLKDELIHPRRSGTMAPPCHLRSRLSCCDGVGFQVSYDGPFTRATLCECVTGCPNCLGRARILEKGFSVPCTKQHPGRMVNLLNQATIPSRYGKAQIQKYSNYSGNGEKVAGQLQSWVSQFHPATSRGMLISGPVGVGKTYLLAGLTKALIYRGYTVQFIDFFRLLQQLKAGYSEDKADAAILDPLINLDVLIIDELGKGRVSDWELSIVDQLVMGRYDQNKTIVASTNYNLSKKVKAGASMDERRFDLDVLQPLSTRVGERIFSRLGEMCEFIELEGQDYRAKLQPTSKSPDAPPPVWSPR